jgi:hypothetical protein
MPLLVAPGPQRFQSIRQVALVLDEEVQILRPVKLARGVKLQVPLACPHPD